MSDDDAIGRKFPVWVVLATAFGGAAYIVGVFLTFLLAGSGQSQAFVDGVQAGAGGSLVDIAPPSDVELSGMLYHVAHVGVDLTFSITIQDRPATAWRDGGLPHEYLYLIPPLVLAGAGYLLAKCYPDVEEAATRVGARVAVGYLLAMAVGALVVFTWNDTMQGSSGFGSHQATVTMAPDLLGSLMYGAGYGIMFGALGGYVYDETTDADGDDPDAAA